MPRLKACDIHCSASWLIALDRYRGSVLRSNLAKVPSISICPLLSRLSRCHWPLIWIKPSPLAIEMSSAVTDNPSALGRAMTLSTLNVSIDRLSNSADRWLINTSLAAKSSAKRALASGFFTHALASGVSHKTPSGPVIRVWAWFTCQAKGLCSTSPPSSTPAPLPTPPPDKPVALRSTVTVSIKPSCQLTHARPPKTPLMSGKLTQGLSAPISRRGNAINTSASIDRLSNRFDDPPNRSNSMDSSIDSPRAVGNDDWMSMRCDNNLFSRDMPIFVKIIGGESSCWLTHVTLAWVKSIRPCLVSQLSTRCVATGSEGVLRSMSKPASLIKPLVCLTAVRSNWSIPM